MAATAARQELDGTGEEPRQERPVLLGQCLCHPILNERQQIIEYQSVRTRPQDHDIAWAERLYARIRAGKALPWQSRVTLEPGQLSLLLSGTALVGMGASLMTGQAGWGGLTLLCLLAQMGHGWHLQQRLARLLAMAGEELGTPSVRCSTPDGGTAWRPSNSCCA